MSSALCIFILLLFRPARLTPKDATRLGLGCKPRKRALSYLAGDILARSLNPGLREDLSIDMHSTVPCIQPILPPRYSRRICPRSSTYSTVHTSYPVQEKRGATDQPPPPRIAIAITR
ncbi:hypothetical protein F4677DRAFT_292922 [Hypoxylon crocopeplum]|nr:hypothetical protein F4677DRAFT_292922 [Hypoxylon crocopeplum]